MAWLQAHPEAAAPAEQLALYEQRGDHAQARDSLIQLGMAHRRADAYEPAIACLNEALQASRTMHDARRAADALYHLGTVAWSNG